MQKLIVAVDPGGTTGYSHIEFEAQSLMSPARGGQLLPQEFCRWLEHVTKAWEENAIIVVERFTISARTLKVSKGGSYDALEVIGVCRYLSLRDCGRDIRMSQPADVMRLFPDQKLKDLGWYIPGKGHANDSLRHLARECARRSLIRVGSPDES